MQRVNLIVDRATLDSMDKREWWDVVRKLDPKCTFARFNRDWQKFLRKKREHARLKAMN